MEPHDQESRLVFRRLVKWLTLLALALSLCSCISNKRTKSYKTHTAAVSENALNINTASTDELEKLPGVGPSTARAIVRHRQKFGKFRRPEHLILVPGVSDSRFRKLRILIRAE